MKSMFCLKNNYFLALLTSLLFCIGWPPNSFPIVIFFSLLPLLVIENNIKTDNRAKKSLRVFFFTYLSTLIWYTFTNWWVLNSSIAAGILAYLVNSMYIPFTFVIYHKVRRVTSTKVGLLFFILMYLSVEYFQMNFELSTPCVNIGFAFSEFTPWVQWLEYTGMSGASLWVLIVNILLFKALKIFIKTRNKFSFKIRIVKIMLLIVFPILISYFIYLNYEEKNDPVKLIIVQPNLDPYEEKFNLNNEKTFSYFYTLFSKKLNDSIDLVIFPETMFPRSINIDYINYDPEIENLKKIAKRYKKTNFIGGISLHKFINNKYELTEESNFFKKDVWVNIYNSSYQLNAVDTLQFYHKSKPMVMVESFPFKKYIEPLFGDLIVNIGGISSQVITTQKERSVFFNSFNSIVAGPIICYETFFDEYITNYVKYGANMLIVMTNDGWWGNTKGPLLNLLTSKYRAIETRRSIARSANTGISAIINQRGDITHSLGYLKTGVIAGQLNKNTTKTFFVKYGDYISRLSVFFMILIYIFSLTKRLQYKSL